MYRDFCTRPLPCLPQTLTIRYLVVPFTGRWLDFPCWCCEGKRFASADKKGEIRLWDPTKGEQQGQPLSAHKQWVTSLAWEPLHRNSAGERLASSSKDALIKVKLHPPVVFGRTVERQEVYAMFSIEASVLSPFLW